jgi:hypothetical protein
VCIPLFLSANWDWFDVARLLMRFTFVGVNADTFLTILISAVSSVSLSAAFVFLFKTWISERLKGAIQDEYNQKLETHKAQLKAESEISIERLKYQLQLTASEKNIKLTRVFEHQAEAIAETYSKLVAVISALEDYTAPMEFEGTPPKSARRIVVGDKMKAFLEYYKPRRIYFPKLTQLNLDAFYLKLHMATANFMFKVEAEHTRVPDGWTESMDFMTKECVELTNALDSDFKKILGLIEDNKITSPEKEIPTQTPPS